MLVMSLVDVLIVSVVHFEWFIVVEKNSLNTP